MGAACVSPGLADTHEVFTDQTGSILDGGGVAGASHGAGGTMVPGKENEWIREWQLGKEKAREWQRHIRQETRQLDRDISNLRREEEKIKMEIRGLANKGQLEQVRGMAKNLVRLRKSVARLEHTKASMTAMSLHLTTQIASMSSASAVKVSSAMMKEANQIVNVQEMQKTMDKMQTEMAKAHFADELMEEALEDPDDETEVDSELQKVYDEVALDASMALRTTPRMPATTPALTPIYGDPMRTHLPHDPPMTRLPSEEEQGDSQLGTQFGALSK